MALVSIRTGSEQRSFRVPIRRVNNWVRALEADGLLGTASEGYVLAEEVFKDLTDKHTRPGASLKGARYKEGISQVELAKKLGIPQGNLSKMENGKRPIGKAMAKRLGKILAIDYRVFL